MKFQKILIFLNQTFNFFPRENKNMQAPRTSVESLCRFLKTIKFKIIINDNYENNYS